MASTVVAVGCDVQTLQAALSAVDAEMVRQMNAVQQQYGENVDVPASAWPQQVWSLNDLATQGLHLVLQDGMEVEKTAWLVQVQRTLPARQEVASWHA
jgi:hypothetical protein